MIIVGWPFAPSDYSAVGACTASETYRHLIRPFATNTPILLSLPVVYIAVTISDSNLDLVIGYYNLGFTSVRSISSVEFWDPFWCVSSNFKILAYLSFMVTLHYIIRF